MICRWPANLVLMRKRFVLRRVRRGKLRSDYFMVALVRSRSLTGYQALVRELGADPQPLLARFRIDDAALDDEEAFISYADMIRLLQATAADLPCPDFGLRLAARQSIPFLGPLALIAQNANTVAEAFTSVNQYLHYLQSGDELCHRDGPRCASCGHHLQHRCGGLLAAQPSDGIDAGDHAQYFADTDRSQDTARSRADAPRRRFARGALPRLVCLPGAFRPESQCHRHQRRASCATDRPLPSRAKTHGRVLYRAYHRATLHGCGGTGLRAHRAFAGFAYLHFEADCRAYLPA